MAITVIIMTFSMRATNNMIITTVPLLAKIDLGFSRFLVGIISAVIYLFTFTVTFYINPRLNSTIRRKLFIGANVAILVALVGYYFADGITVWIISALAGLAYGIMMPNLITSSSLLKDQRDRERLISLYSVGLSLSLILGPTIEDYILTFVSYRDVFLFFIPVVVAGLIVSTMIKFPNTKNETRANVMKNDGLRASILTITTYNVPFAALSIFLTLYAISKFHVSGAVAYSPYIYFFSVSFLTRIALTVHPLKHIKIPLIISIIITGFALTMFPFLSTFTDFLLLMMLLGIPHGSIFPMSTIMIARGTTVEQRSAANSYFMAYNNILFMIIPLVFGYIVGFIGYDYSFFILIIPVIASAIYLFKIYGNNSTIFISNLKHQQKVSVEDRQKA
ncbi:MAG: MFS transporter [Ferroplasma sp.]|uniref:MFS transporter n=1 Tax=Ferroplasma sp. TaxID=2591003 RepID=UPI002815D941|nr:MFS transporter [Ferroplasma sp.]WMT52046.1 MAG: MFS transporter [Ferroplasma sp.]